MISGLRLQSLPIKKDGMQNAPLPVHTALVPKLSSPVACDGTMPSSVGIGYRSFSSFFDPSDPLPADQYSRSLASLRGCEPGYESSESSKSSFSRSRQLDSCSDVSSDDGRNPDISMEDKEVRQRNSMGLYNTQYFFPSAKSSCANLTDEMRLNRNSLTRASTYKCKGTLGCRNGVCLSSFHDSDVMKRRQSMMARRVAMNGKEIPMVDLLVSEIGSSYDRTAERWNTICVSLDEVCSVNICVAAYGLLHGYSSTSLGIATRKVKLGECFSSDALIPRTQKDWNDQKSLDFSMLRAYVADLLDKHEANPAPGAHQPGRMTHINKSTWKEKWKNCETHFGDARTPGSMSMLKRVWKLEKRLKEKKACSHSKCDNCSKIDKGLVEINGVNTTTAKFTRACLFRAKQEHEEQHLSQRMDLDQAGLKAMVDPRHMWCIIADAATQRNFLLPKFQHRTPKKLANKPLWSYKLMGTYAYGFGFFPFLIHDSQKMGANLTWTVIWITLCELRDHYGYWPDVLHLTLDNASGENKNEYSIAMCAWLVSSGKVKQVRMLYLLVGHTHIVIDHIFGVVTVGLRRKELLVPEDLMRNIDQSLSANPQYMARKVRILHCLWDFHSFVDVQMQWKEKITKLNRSNDQDQHGTYNGMYDFLFLRNSAGHARLKYREHVSHAWRPEGSNGAETILNLPTSAPSLASIKSKDKWAKQGSTTVRDTIMAALDFAHTANIRGNFNISRIWDGHFRDVPECIELLRPALRLEFRYFFETNDVPRIGFRADANPEQNAEESDFDARYREWQKHHIDIRTDALAIDPVISSEQTESEYTQRKIALQATLRVDPSPTISKMAPIFLSDFVLAMPVGAIGVDLYNVQGISGTKTPFALDLDFLGVQYEHVPNPEVSGLFGTFRMKMTLEADKRSQTRVTLSRNEVRVFNVTLLKSRVLCLQSLRALAMSLPEAYPFPAEQDIPDSHFDLPKQRQARKKAASAQAKPAPKARNSRKASLPKKKGSEDASDSSSSSEPSDSIDEENSSSSSSDSSGSGSNGSDGGKEDDIDNERGETHESASPTSPVAAFDVPLLMAALPDPTVDTIVLLNMKDDPEYLHMQYPIGIAYVISSNPFQVLWYQLSRSQFRSPSRRHGPAGFRTELKFLTFQKCWNDANLWARHKKPTEDEIMQNWHRDNAHKNWLLQVTIPQESDARKYRMADSFRLPMAFVTTTLIPACLEACCLHA